MRAPWHLAPLLAVPLSAAPAVAAPPALDLDPAPRPKAFARPASQGPACSLREEVCVHAPSWMPAVRSEQVLQVSERMLSTLRALRLPAPLRDGALGGTSALDVYLVSPTIVEDGAAKVWADAPLPPLGPRGGLDAASAFVALGEVDTSSCQGRSLVARAVVETALLGLDPGLEEGSLAMASTWIAAHVEPCRASEVAGVDAFQAHPELPIMASADLRAERWPGSLLFAEHLEATSTAPPGTLLALLTALSSQRTPLGSPTWGDEPDLFDVLRSSLRFQERTIEELLLDFTADRAFVGARGDGSHLLGAESYGAAGRVRFDWNIPVGSLPRRLGPLHPTGPTGATYVWLDLAGAPAQLDLGLRAEWEKPAVFHWALIKVDPQGREVGRYPIRPPHGTQLAERSFVVDTKGLAGIVLAGVNLGSMNRTLPYDPDDPPEPHGYELSLFAQ